MGTLLNPTREDVNARSPHNQASYITCCVSCFHINLNMKPNNHDLFAIVQGEILLKQYVYSLSYFEFKCEARDVAVRTNQVVVYVSIGIF